MIDKTGTATTGRMSLQSISVAEGVSEAQALWLVGALQNGSEHPIGRAIAAAARTLESEPADVEDFASHAGLGVQGTVAGRAIIAGRPALLESADPSLALPPELERARLEAEAEGRTAIAASWDGAAQALFVVADSVKPTSREAVRRLHELGLRTILLTGDNAATARAVAARIGVDDVIADVLPADKAAVVRRLQEEGRTVAMVGDGVNDAPALAQADLGMAIGTGTDVAIEASDITLVSGDLRLAADALRLSRRTLRTIKTNLFWAFAYNVAALPLAAAGPDEPDDRRRRDGRLERLRRRQLAAPARRSRRARRDPDPAPELIGILRLVSRRALLPGLLATVVAAALAVSACGGSSGPSSADAVIEPLPTRNTKAKAVEPVAGESGAYSNLPSAQPGDEPKARGASVAAAEALAGDRDRRTMRRSPTPTCSTTASRCRRSRRPRRCG